MIAAIVGAEVAFWVLLLGGLAVRYLLRRERVSTWLLRSVPLVDVVLVVLVAIDVARGAEPSTTHAVAAVYLGITLAFGRATIAWADARFRHRFADGPKPVKPAKGSRAEVRAIWTEWLRLVLAAAIAAGLILILAAVQGSPLPTSAEQIAQHPYWSVLALTAIITAVWFLAGPAFAGTGSDVAASTAANRPSGAPVAPDAHRTDE